MAYLTGLVLGNGEIQQNNRETTVTIDLPYKNLYTDDNKDVAIYVMASVVDIRTIIEPLIGHSLAVSEQRHSTKLSFTKPNSEYVIRELIRIVGAGRHHSTMTMSEELFQMSTDERKSLLRGIADATAYIRHSNMAFGKNGMHRVYIEIPNNWYMVTDIANMLKSVDVPIQTIDFGHPNFRDSQKKKYNEGKTDFWKKEHQIKIYANEFLPIGFSIRHKQQALAKYAKELLEYADSYFTHKYYWEKNVRHTHKPIHPCENDPSLPTEIRSKHFDSWTDLAKLLGYGK